MARTASRPGATIAYEGRVVVVALAALIALAAAFAGPQVLWPGLPLVGLAAWYCRDPERRAVLAPRVLVAPCDGRVRGAGPATDPWLGRAAHRVTVDMGWLDAHGLYAPVEGKIVAQWSTPPGAAAGRRRRASGFAYHIRSDDGADVVLEVNCRRPGAGMRCTYQPGERIGGGRRIGFLPFACDVTVYAEAMVLPASSAGARASGGRSELLQLVPVSTAARPFARSGDVAA